MSDIKIIRSHSLPIPKAKALVQKVVDRLAAEHDLSSEWHGHTLRFHRSGVHGEMHVTDSEVRLHVTLGLLLKPFKGTLVAHIERNFERYLPERESKAHAKEPARKMEHTEA